MEIDNLPKKELRIMIVEMIQDLGKGIEAKIEKMQEMFTRDLEEINQFKLVLEKAEEPEIKLPTSAGSSKKQESSTKTSISALLTMPKPSTVWITINCGKF